MPRCFHRGKKKKKNKNSMSFTLYLQMGPKTRKNTNDLPKNKKKHISQRRYGYSWEGTRTVPDGNLPENLDMTTKFMWRRKKKLTIIIINGCAFLKKKNNLWCVFVHTLMYFTHKISNVNLVLLSANILTDMASYLIAIHQQFLLLFCFALLLFKLAQPICSTFLCHLSAYECSLSFISVCMCVGFFLLGFRQIETKCIKNANKLAEKNRNQNFM